MKSPEDSRPQVLIVDDDPTIRMLLSAVLRREDRYELLEAPDGSAARAILQQRPFDVVITDLVMPGLDGLSLLRWAQQNCTGPTWIILSGRATFDDAIEAIRLGAFDFVTKPLTVLDRIVVAVRNAVRQRELRAEHERLDAELHQRNAQLDEQVTHLKDACRMLCDQAEIIGEDLRRAELIQRAMLPRDLPETPGFAVDALYRPSRKVGGDLYDVIRVGPGHLVAYVADAAGSGVSAAMLAVLFKHRLQLTDAETARPIEPTEVLRRVNRALVEECPHPELFVTAIFCLLDLETGDLRIASGGHPPGLLHRSDGRIEMILHGGPALGIEKEATFAQTATELRVGDRLLLYTDGLLDGAPQPDRLTGDHLTKVLADGETTGELLLHTLLDMSADRRGGTLQEDDITMLLLSAAERPSTVDNGAPELSPTFGPLIPPGDGEVLIGRTDLHTAVSIRGRATWSYCPSFHDACMGELKERRPLTLDFSQCRYLDSTFLGTVQEVVDRAKELGTVIRLQGVGAEVQHLFGEVGMDRVIARFAADTLPMPSQMAPLWTGVQDQERDRTRVLRAHEVLAALNDRNRADFHRLIEGIRTELEQCDTS